MHGNWNSHHGIWLCQQRTPICKPTVTGVAADSPGSTCEQDATCVSHGSVLICSKLFYYEMICHLCTCVLAGNAAARPLLVPVRWSSYRCQANEAQVSMIDWLALWCLVGKRRIQGDWKYWNWIQS